MDDGQRASDQAGGDSVGAACGPPLFCVSEKKAAYAEYRAARGEMRELMVHRKNLALILQGDAKEGKGKEAKWEGR